RGLARKTSMPKRPVSYFGPPEVIISMAQQARPKVAGQKEALRMYPARPSTVVSSTPLGSLSSTPMVLVPVQSAATPFVDVGECDVDEEEHDGGHTEPGQLVEVDGPRHEEHDLDVEDDEGHRDGVVLHREAAAA